MAYYGIVHAFKVELAQNTWGMKTNEHSCGQISAIMLMTSRGANISCQKKFAGRGGVLRGHLKELNTLSCVIE
jgi:hypothetical protein